MTWPGAFRHNATMGPLYCAMIAFGCVMHAWLSVWIREAACRPNRGNTNLVLVWLSWSAQHKFALVSRPRGERANASTSFLARGSCIWLLGNSKWPGLKFWTILSLSSATLLSLKFWTNRCADHIASCPRTSGPETQSNILSAEKEETFY